MGLVICQIVWLMGKKIKEVSRETMDALQLDQRLDGVEKTLNEILLCLKGSESMNIEGVLPAQKRALNELRIVKQDLEEIKLWRTQISNYLGLITSRKVWKIIIIIIGVFASFILGMKYGFSKVIQVIKLIGSQII